MGLNQLARDIHDIHEKLGFWDVKHQVDKPIENAHSYLRYATALLEEGGSPRHINLETGNQFGVPGFIVCAMLNILSYCAHEEIDVEEALNAVMERHLGAVELFGSDKM